MRIRGIGFLQLLDMTDEEVKSILRDYGDSDDEIDHVLAGLAKIRGNIDLIESDLTFEDDTRNLIKLVLQLLEDTCTNDESASTCGLNEDEFNENKTPSLYVISPETQMQNCKDFVTFKSSLNNSENKYRSYNHLKMNSNLSIESKINACNLNDVNSKVYINEPVDHNTKPLSYSSIKRHRNQQVHELNSCDVNLLDVESGFLFPSNLVKFSNTNTLGTKSLSVLSRSSRKILGTDCVFSVSPTCRRINGVREKDKHNRQVGTPPPKHRFKFSTPIHRSKSHESNLALRINACGTGALVHYQDSYLPRHCLLEQGVVSSDRLSNNLGDCSLYLENNMRSSMNTVLYPSYTESVSNPNTNLFLNTLHSTSAFDITCGTNIRSASSEHHPPKNNLQLPALMTTSADGENLLGEFTMFLENGYLFNIICIKLGLSLHVGVLLIVFFIL